MSIFITIVSLDINLGLGTRGDINVVPFLASAELRVEKTK